MITSIKLGTAGACVALAASCSDSNATADAGAGNTKTADGSVTDAAPPDAVMLADAGFAVWLDVEDIEYEEVNPPMTGSVIYYNTWGFGDGVHMMRADGSSRRTRFTARRVWSFALASDGQTIAFSSSDPRQQEHWGTSVNDAVQYTWLLRPQQRPEQLTTGSINDECYEFLPGDSALLLCRSANFGETPQDTARIVRVDIDNRHATWLTPIDRTKSRFNPTRRADGKILFGESDRSPPFASRLMIMDGDGDNRQVVRENCNGPKLSPDKTKVLYRQNWRKLIVADANDPANGTVLIDGGDDIIFGFSYSPDQTQLVYEQGRGDAQCSDIWVANADGSNRHRIIDCVAENLFITQTQWVRLD